MSRLRQHLVRNFFAGVVALLPVAGLVLTVAYLESTIAQSWLAQQPFYFPGFGLFAAAFVIYFIGLLVSTFIGKWIWSRVDAMLDKAPTLGRLYQTLKQVLGYGEGKEAVFQQVVLVPGNYPEAEEIGLVTNEIRDGDDVPKLLVFIPGVPNPTSGRLLWMRATQVRPLAISVNEALKHLVSLGKLPLEGVPSVVEGQKRSLP